ncbi:MAG TPA: ABC transporter substrate-binding protein [Gaiellaceae bacterium]|nr:ABC transporter substrate-binding protein [Gaiellaceae bacterium]
MDELVRNSGGALSRREVLKRAGVGAGGLMLGGAFVDPAWARPRAEDASNTITIGVVSPRTGPAAGFGEGDPYIVGVARKALATGLTIGGKHYSVNVIEKDSQSTPARAAQVANDLIHGNNVDLMLATSTPETVNPVSDASEAARVPCISTVVPWEAWYFGRGAKPGGPSPFRYTYHFSFGVAQFASAYEHLWPQVKTNKRVGVMWPNDDDGNAIRAALGPLLEKAGYKIVDPGAYADGTNDYSSQIAKFRSNNCQIFNTFPIPPDFTTFWRQAAQQGYTSKVKIAQIAKTGLFPSQVSVLGKLGYNLASGAYWTPTYPYTSSLTKLTSKQIGNGYSKQSGREWNQQLGATMALFDVGIAALKASKNPKDKDAVANAVKTLSVNTPVGHLHWGTGGAHNPVPNVVTTPIIGGQWRHTPGKRFSLDFLLCEHSADPHVPIQSHLKAY